VQAELIANGDPPVHTSEVMVKGKTNRAVSSGKICGWPGRVWMRVMLKRNAASPVRIYSDTLRMLSEM